MFSDFRNPGALPQVRHGESVLWRTLTECRAFGAPKVFVEQFVALCALIWYGKRFEGSTGNNRRGYAQLAGRSRDCANLSRSGRARARRETQEHSLAHGRSGRAPCAALGEEA